ncbi:unnamed protein product [Fraxinus pennsylvanica]|uniref:Malectin-like domain-containing protein n=1 Tax=Fraxinus pennsylvanica TaxID=56036 RepID=A0AAD2A8D8_9LAMI|nr:unnamed protein product [Fraxinus pennsylvanica]
MGLLGLLWLVTIFGFMEIGKAQRKSFLISCGTNSSVTVDGRRWIGDKDPGSNVTFSASGIEASTETFSGDPVYKPLYKTARIFTDSLNYTVQGTPGNYFLRLHFYPLAYMNYNANDSVFAVESNGLRLVSEFNVPGEILNKNSNFLGSGGNSSFTSLVKEYFFTIDADVIVVAFIPSKGSFGFVNAIEIIPVDNKLFNDSVRRVSGNGGSSSLNIDKRGVETMHRLNVGGSAIKPSQDLDFWRTWEVDSSYMVNPDAGSEIKNRTNITYSSPNGTFVAPLPVYETARILSNTEVLDKRFNMSWKLEVDPDFDYLVRLHFCELFYDKPNQRIFRIYINNRTAAENFDIFVRAGGMNKAYHEDYFDVISSKISTLWIQLGPDTTTGSAGTDALLNGLEVFKLSQNGNLAYVQKYINLEGKKTSKSFLWVGIGAGIASIAILAALVMLIVWFCKQKNKDHNDDAKKTAPGWQPLFLHGSIANRAAKATGSTAYQNPNGAIRSGRRFTLAEIRVATNNFDESLGIGVGGFGKLEEAWLHTNADAGENSVSSNRDLGPNDVGECEVQDATN